MNSSKSTLLNAIFPSEGGAWGDAPEEGGVGEYPPEDSDYDYYDDELDNYDKKLGRYVAVR